MDYCDIKSCTQKEVEEQALTLEKARKDPSMRKATEEEIQKLEDYLEVQRGVLKNIEWWGSDVKDNDGSNIGILDFVRTAVEDSNHSKSFILHVLIGNKHIINPPRTIRTSSGLELAGHTYSTLVYHCRDTIMA